MVNYLLLYYGEPLPEDESERREVVATWDKWMREVGNSLIDGGGQTARGQSLTATDRAAISEPAVTGYSLIEAESLDEAMELARGAPVLLQGGRVDVYAVPGV